MGEAAVEYDPRYLAGVLLFNGHDFFAAHEVWEDLWAELAGADRRFVQGLIQAAVGLCHFGNGNIRGAVKLYHSSRDYMMRVDSPHWGLDIPAFWRQMEACFSQALAHEEGQPRPSLDEGRSPQIALEPPPAAWPDPADYLEEDDETPSEHRS
jgi:predicted metal-dependent hydrolase